jgi:ABC-type polar amino acid transport system ATPase subunit
VSEQPSSGPLDERSEPPVVDLRSVAKRFGSTEVLKGVSFQVQRGQVAVVLGRSGSGKSTMLRCLNGLAPPDSGEVHLHGALVASNGKMAVSRRELRLIRARMPMVFQRFNLWEHMDALKNVTIPQVQVLGRSADVAQQRAVEALTRVGLSHRMRNYPHQLSGGEQQRVGIARALAMDPHVILLDEPTSSLDPELIGEVLTILLQLAEEGMTMVVVTHEMRFARKAANRVFFVDSGLIVEEGTPEQIFEAPQHGATRSFVEAIGG